MLTLLSVCIFIFIWDFKNRQSGWQNFSWQDPLCLWMLHSEFNQQIREEGLEKWVQIRRSTIFSPRQRNVSAQIKIRTSWRTRAALNHYRVLVCWPCWLRQTYNYFSCLRAHWFLIKGNGQVWIYSDSKPMKRGSLEPCHVLCSRHSWLRQACIVVI